MSRRIDAALLRRVGRPCLWERAIPSLKRAATGALQFLENPPQDRGYKYAPPIRINALFTSDRREEAFEVAGAWERGNCSMTFEADLELGEQDRITLLDLPVRDLAEIERGADASDPLPLRRGVALLSVESELESFGVGRDVRLETSASGDSALVWIHPPALGTLLSIVLTALSIWIVVDSPIIRAFGSGAGRQLLKRATLKRDDTQTRRI